VNVKDAVKKAVAYVADVFAAEGVTNIGLEEVMFDEASQEWVVTVGFSRPWDYPKGVLVTMANQQPARALKVLRIRDQDGEVLSIKNR
jgi:hypothetical protein